MLGRFAAGFMLAALCASGQWYAFNPVTQVTRRANGVEFTQRTMATVKLADVKPDLTQSWWYKRAHLAVVAAAGAGVLVASGLLGYASTNRWVPSNEDLLLRDLPVIQNIDEYRQIGQHEFLERLEGQPHLMQEIQEEVRNARAQ